jgi:hypothetical protein
MKEGLHFSNIVNRLVSLASGRRGQVPPRDVEPMEEEEVVLNTVTVFLDSINWLIFVIITSVYSGR